MKSSWLKRIGAIAIASTVVVGCSSSTATQAPTQAPATAGATTAASVVASAAAAGKTGPFVIGVSNDSVANAFRVQMENEIKYYATQHKDTISNLIVLDANGDTNKQISDVEDLIARKVDAIILSPNSSTALNPAIADAKTAGIPVATYNMTVSGDGVNNVLTQIAPPFQQWETDQVTWLAAQMGGKGNVIALRGIAGTPVDAEEWAGATSVLNANPNIKVICSEYASWDYGTAKTAVANCLANHPEVNGILSIGDAMTWAAGEVMAAQGYDLSKIPMIGIGGGNGALKWWLTNVNTLNMQMIGDRTDVAVFATEAAINYLQGKTGATVDIPETVVTKDNIAKYAQPTLPDAVWLIGTQIPVDVLKTMANS